LAAVDDRHEVGVPEARRDRLDGLDAEPPLERAMGEIDGDRERLGAHAVRAADLDGDARADDAAPIAVRGTHRGLSSEQRSDHPVGRSTACSPVRSGACSSDARV
jgi:hypothetical protein